MPFREIPSALQDHLENVTTTLANIWRIERKDGKIFRFTDADIPLKIENEEYVPVNAGTSSAINNTSMPKADNLTIEHILNSDYVSESDVRKGLFDFAEISVSLVNFRDPSQGTTTVFKGFFGQVTLHDDVNADIELKSLSTKLNETFGRQYFQQCDAQLGDDRCGVNLSGEFEFNGSVENVMSNSKFQDSSLDIDVSYGIVEFTSGLNSGTRREIKRYSNNIDIHSIDIDNNIFILEGNETGAFSVGDTFDVINSSGNDGTYTVSNVSYSNRFGKMTKNESDYYDINEVLSSSIEISGDPFNLDGGDGDISEGDSFTITDSEEYNGEYTVLSASYSDGVTTINTEEHLGWPYYTGYTEVITNENISSSTPDGEISYADDGIIELWFPTPYKIEAGDNFDATAGCDKSFTTCKEKYGNQKNFRGFPHIPGRDNIMRYPNAK